MVPDRFTLELWGKYATSFALVCLLLSAVLARAEASADASARHEVARHRWDCHPEEMDDE